MSKPLPEIVRHCAELLAPLGAVRVMRMFGGHGLYVDELFIAIVIAERFYLKVDDETKGTFEQAGGAPFEYQRAGETASIGYRTPPEEAIESPALMQPWARLAIGAALRARAAKTPKATQAPARTTGAKAARTLKPRACPARSTKR